MRIRLLIPALLLSVTPIPLAAEGDAATVAAGRTPRRTLLAVVGALAGGSGGAVLHHDGSGTSRRTCTIGAGALVGGIARLLIGRKVEQAYGPRYRRAPRLRIPFVERMLDGDPIALTARDTLLAVATSTGVAVFSSTGVLITHGRRATGIRGIAEPSQVAHTRWPSRLPPAFTLSTDPRPGVLLREGTIQAASASDAHVFFSLDSSIEWARLASDSLRVWLGLEGNSPVVDLEWDSRRKIVWARTDPLILAPTWNGDSLVTSSGRASRLADHR